MNRYAIPTLLLAVLFVSVQLRATPDGKKTKSQPQASGVHSVNVDQSNVEWIGKKVIGSSHNGTIAIKSGSLTLKDGKVTGGRFEIDMQSIVNKDLTNADLNAKLVGHLKSDDFFSVQKFPVASFIMSNAVFNSKAGNSDPNYTITGDLRIKGITKKITFPARIETNDNKTTANAKIVFDRSKFDVRYGSGSFFDNLGDNMIEDDITLNVSLTAMK